MKTQTRIEKLEQAAQAAADGDFVTVITWEGPGRHYRLVDGQRVPCKKSDIPLGRIGKAVVAWGDEATP